MNILNNRVIEKALNYLCEESGEQGVKQCLLVQKGQVLYRGEESHVVHNLWSTTKSFTSTLLGLMIDDRLCGLTDFACEYEPILKEKYSRVRLSHFASMTSGYQAKRPTRFDLKDDWSWDYVAPAEPLFKPGEAFCYWDNAQNMFGRVLTQILKGDLYEYLKERILLPLGITQSDWLSEGEINGNPIRFGCSNLSMNADDLTRFGTLFLNNGLWEGKQLISREWINLATAPQVPSWVPTADTERSDMVGSGFYGFNWWLNGVKSDGYLSLEGAPRGTFFSSGLHNNMCFVIPAWDMVFVRMGIDGNPPKGKFPVYSEFFRILSAHWSCE